MSAPFRASLAFCASSTDSNVNELVKDESSGSGQLEEKNKTSPALEGRQL